MTTITDFITILGKENSGWHEGNLNIAAEITLDFTQNDWQWLLDNAIKMPLYLQERCAEAIGYLEKEEAVPTLISLLDSNSIFVASIAAAELGNLSVSLPVIYQKKLKQIMEYLIKQKSSRLVEVKALQEKLINDDINNME